jgi:rhamnose transport system permease protein
MASVIYTSRVYTARGDSGLGLELDVISAVVLGGASIYGGSGTIGGTVLGVLIIATLRNGLVLAGVPAPGRSSFWGSCCSWRCSSTSFSVEGRCEPHQDQSVREPKQ